MDPLKKQILFIDDDVFLEKIVRYNLKDSGYLFTSTQNGEEAMSILRNRKQDMIILDLIMPKMDGWKFLEWIKAEDSLSDIPIIILTAFEGNKSEILEKHSKLRIVEIVGKPFELRKLISRIKQTLDPADP